MGFQRTLLYVAIFVFITATSPVAANPTAKESTLKKLEIFAKSLNYIEANYVQDVDIGQLLDGALHGMLRVLDPHTLYLPPQRYSKMKMRASGKYHGIGLEIIVEERGVVIVTPIEGSPAFAAGIKPGDVILDIDGVSTKGMSEEQVEKKLQGQVDTKVSLLIQEKDSGITRTVDLIRAVVEMPSVSIEQIGRIAYVKIASFQNKTADAVRRKLEPLYKKKQPIEGIILDMRNNPGGLLDEAVNLVDLFLDKGLIVSTRGRRQEYIEKRIASRKNTLPLLPTVALINGGTASAPEIVAGALKDHRKAVIMGTRSFGKGSVQTVIDLEDGSALKITVATYFTPKGFAIQAQGIKPDIIVEPEIPDVFHVVSESLREEDLQNHLPNENERATIQSAKNDLLQSDLQLKRAVDHLHAWITFANSKPAAENSSHSRQL